MQKSNIFMNTTNKINTVRYLTDEDLLKLDASYYAIKRKKYLRSECVNIELMHMQYDMPNEYDKAMGHIEF